MAKLIVYKELRGSYIRKKDRGNFFHPSFINKHNLSSPYCPLPKQLTDSTVFWIVLHEALLWLSVIGCNNPSLHLISQKI